MQRGKQNNIIIANRPGLQIIGIASRIMEISFNSFLPLFCLLLLLPALLLQDIFVKKCHPHYMKAIHRNSKKIKRIDECKKRGKS